MVEQIRKIGFIGLGAMGGDQARQLAKLPLQLMVYDVAANAMAAFSGKATLGASMADCGRDADVVGLCVRDDAQVNECVDALFPVMKRGSILLIHSTVSPATAIAVAARGAAAGIEVLDAPVTRTEMHKDGPFVFCMTAGSEAAAAQVQGILAAFSTNTLHIGPSGAAMALKICNNIASWCEIVLGLEVAAIAAGAGVPLEKLITVMNRNGVMSPPMEAFMRLRNSPGLAAKRAFLDSQAGIGEKDLALGESLAAGAGAPASITHHVKGLLRASVLGMIGD